MHFKGNYRFPEETSFGTFGSLIDLFSNREYFDVYYCPQCGKVEFFIPKEKESEED